MSIDPAEAKMRRGSAPPSTTPPTEPVSPPAPPSPPTTGATTSPSAALRGGSSTGQSLPYTGDAEEREFWGATFAIAMGYGLHHYYGERRGV